MRNKANKSILIISVFVLLSVFHPHISTWLLHTQIIQLHVKKSFTQLNKVSAYTHNDWGENTDIAHTTLAPRSSNNIVNEQPNISAPLANTAPIAIDSTLTSIHEDPLSNTGDSIASLTISSDSDVGALSGIAITTVDNRNGMWEFSIDGGSTWSGFWGVSSSAARLLAANNLNHRIRFRPDSNYTGTSTLIYRAWDQTSGTAGGTASVTSNGGSTAYSSNTALATITIAPTNDSPEFYISKSTSTPFTYVNKIGTAGSGNGQVNQPHGVAVDSAGNIYITDSANHRIQKFTAAGVYIAKWGSLGSGNGQFNYPAKIVIDKLDTLYVSDYNNHRIQVFDTNGTYLYKWGTLGSGNSQFRYPVGMGFDSSGYLWVADADNDRVQKFDRTGAWVAAFGSTGTGNGQFDRPYDITIDNADNIYVTEEYNDRIQKFTPNGLTNWTWQWKQGSSVGAGNGQFNNPFGVASDGFNTLYVADFSNHRIQTFTTTSPTWTYKVGGSASSSNGLFNGPIGINTDRKGNVYVTEYSGQRIQIFTTVESNTTIAEDTAMTLPIYLIDAEYASDTPSFTASSSDPSILSVSINYTSGDSALMALTPQPDQFGSATITVRATDTVGDFTEQTLVVTVTPAQDAPVAIDSTTASIVQDITNTANTGTSIGSISPLLSDPDEINGATTLKGMAITGANNSNGLWQYTTNGGTSWSTITTLSDTSAMLLSTTNANHKIRFVPNAGFAGNATLSFRAWDQTTGTAGTLTNVSTNGGSTAYSSNTASLTITVNSLATPTSTPSNTPTSTLTSSPTPTLSPSPTASSTHTSTVTPSLTSTNSPTSTLTSSPTPTLSPSPTASSTHTSTVTPSLTSTNSPTNTRTNSPTPSSTHTSTATPSLTSTNSPTNTRTNSPTPSSTHTSTATPSLTSTNSPTNTRTSSPTPSSTLTLTATPSPTPTNSPTNTRTSSPTPTLSPSLTNTETRTKTLTYTPTTTTPTTLITASITATPSITATSSPYAQIQVTLRDQLTTDSNRDGKPSPGDTITYTAFIYNLDTRPITNVSLSVAPDENTTLIRGSVTTNQGTVISGNTTSQNRITVNIERINPGDYVQITYRTTIKRTLPSRIMLLSTQALVSATNIITQTSDDPDTQARDDATTTLLSADTFIQFSNAQTLFIDIDGDGMIDPGDSIRFTARIINNSFFDIRNVVLTNPNDGAATLETALTTTSQGVISAGATSGDTTVRVQLGTIPRGTSAVVHYVITIPHTIPTTTSRISNQPIISYTDPRTLRSTTTRKSDDPATAILDDPTITTLSSTSRLVVTKRISLMTDVDGDNQVDPFDILLYQIRIQNFGNAAHANSTFLNLLDNKTTLMIGSVQTSQGNVVIGNGSGHAAVYLELGDIDAQNEINISYRARINLNTSGTIISQATVSSPGVPDIVTDNPHTLTLNDPTTMRIGAAPTYIVLTNFRVVHNRHTHIIRWSTASEIGTWRFRVYRINATGKRVLVPACANVIAKGSPSRGADYRCIDKVTSSARYVLEEVTRTGSSTFYQTTLRAVNRGSSIPHHSFFVP